MSERDESIKKRCKLFKLLSDGVPDFCNRRFNPKVEWQKFCSNKNKCHDEYWKRIYREKAMIDKRLERLEKKAGINK